MAYFHVHLVGGGGITIEDKRSLNELVQSAASNGFLVYEAVNFTPANREGEEPIITRSGPAAVMLHSIQKIEAREYSKSGRPISKTS